MRKRNTFSTIESLGLSVNPDFLGAATCGILLGLLIWYVPPTHPAIILSACVLLGMTLYLIGKHIIPISYALLTASAIGLVLFVYLLGMLDVTNGIILTCLIASLGILMHQK